MNRRTVATGRAVCLFASVTAFTSTSVWAQTNSWISPTGGKWEQGTNWSLGVPPGAGQTVFVANHGWKAVDIDNNTAVNFPQTMTIGSLNINSPGTDTVNTVLVNFAGLQTPLNASSYIEVSNNANMVILQSAVQTGFFQTWPGGSVTEDVSSQVSVSNELIVSGAYYFTNGTLNVPLANGAGESVGGQFVQAGGSNFTGGLLVTGEYDISGGELVVPAPGAPGQIGILDFGNFVQSGGTVSDWLSVGQTGASGGTYQLSGGLLQVAFIGLPTMATMGGGTTPDSSFLIQTGGTNMLGSMDVGDTLFGDPRLGLGTYLLTNGLLVSGGVTINGQGNFHQEGGVHSNTSMTLTQTELMSIVSPFTNYFAPAHYFLDGGTFTSGSVSDQSSVFSQTGGQLTISNMSLSGGATFSQTGGTVTQTGTLTLDSSSIAAGNGTQQFGKLLLSGSTNSTLTLAPGASVLHFANSSSQVWSNTAMLIVSNWNGSLSGGGADQIFFGTDSTGLTAQQLSQIKFINPAGLAPGTYSAQILSDGEVVPSSGSSGSGLVNSWINPASGNWQDATSWSLGILPASSQTVVITNSGFKAVAIISSTPINFPGSMTVSNLTITSPSNSFNTLLMNFVAAGNPLRVGSNAPGNLVIGPNSAMAMFSSGLIVNNSLGTNNSRLGEFAVNGTFTQSDSSEVVAGFLDLNSTGNYNLTNGQVFIGSQFINGTFNHQGGTNFGAVIFTDGGTYNLFAGVLQGSVGLDAPLAGVFNQSGGTDISSLDLSGPGLYQLSGGLLVPGDLQVGPSSLAPSSLGAGAVVQTGGTDNAGNITMGVGSYTLEGGVLTASNLSLPTVSDRLGSFGSSFNQSGGSFSNSSISMNGVVDPRNGFQPSTYTLSGGQLQTPSITMTMGLFNQTGGTNSARVVTLNTLSSYNFTNGLLIADNIQVSGQSTFVHAGGSFSGLKNILLAGGTWVERTAGEQLGQLQLGSGTNSSSLNLPSGSCVLRFADSSAVAWASGARLTIQNWSGSTNGGGAQQIFFGTSASGLTAQQLSQVQFTNPAGLPPGTYSARILSSGEVVPNQIIGASASVAFSEQGNNLILTWPTGWTLQSATNVLGVYSDVSGATSPFTNNDTLAPRKFFRLRH